MSDKIDKIIPYKKESVNEDDFTINFNLCKTGLDRNRFIENNVDLRKVFEYSTDSCTFLKWKTTLSCKTKIGNSAGTKSRYGKIGRERYNVGVFGCVLKAHRVVYLLHNNSIPDLYVIDHIDGNPLNNDINNLRCITKKLNNRSVAMRENSTVDKTGVGLYYRDGVGYYMAFWVEGGRNKFKTFSVKKYGEETAKLLAYEARDKAFEELINEGEWYGERHGQKLIIN